jgi:hypothetical protein
MESLRHLYDERTHVKSGSVLSECCTVIDIFFSFTDCVCFTFHLNCSCFRRTMKVSSSFWCTVKLLQNPEKKLITWNVSFSVPYSTESQISGVSFVIGRSQVQISFRRLAILASFPWLSSVPPGKFQDSVLNYATAASFHIRSNSLYTNHSIIPHCNLQYVILKTSLNKNKHTKIKIPVGGIREVLMAANMKMRLLGCCTMQSGRSVPSLQTCLLSYRKGG